MSGRSGTSYLDVLCKMTIVGLICMYVPIIMTCWCVCVCVRIFSVVSVYRDECVHVLGGLMSLVHTYVRGAKLPAFRINPISCKLVR
jgi:hypothetical protein